MKRFYNEPWIYQVDTLTLHPPYISQIAKKTGLGLESLYKALSAEGNPEFFTVMKVVQALGLQLHARSGKTSKVE